MELNNDADDSPEDIEAEAADVIASDEGEGAGSRPDTVRVKLGHSGHAAGHYFDDADEIKEIDYNRRVELALERGTLTRV